MKIFSSTIILSIKFTGFLLLLSFSSPSLFSLTILIDPGHGGAEVGATLKGKDSKGHSRYIKEKDLTLKYAKKLKEVLQKNHDVYLTRSYDKLISLEERAKMADIVNADLFISLHANAHKNKNISGFEIYYLNNRLDDTLERIEELEEEHKAGHYGDLPKRSDSVSEIVLGVMVRYAAKKSRILADLIHKEFKKSVLKKHGIKDRGRRPGLFYVLALSKRPTVLIELGYLTNKRDLQKLMKKETPQEVAMAISKGINNYVGKKISQNF